MINETQQFIKSIEQIEHFLLITNSEEREDFDSNIEYLKNRIFKIQHIISTRSKIKHEDIIMRLMFDLHLCLIDIMADLKDINILINKTVKNKKQQEK